MHIKYTVFPLFLTVTLLACSPAQAKQSSTTSGSEIDIVNSQQIEWEQLFLLNEDNYLVFVYSETCNNCHEIMDEVVTFALDDILPMYFIDKNNPINEIPVTSNTESSYGATEIEDVSILGVPTLIEIDQGFIACNTAGRDNCLTLLNEKRLNR